MVLILPLSLVGIPVDSAEAVLMVPLTGCALGPLETFVTLAGDMVELADSTAAVLVVEASDVLPLRTSVVVGDTVVPVAETMRNEMVPFLRKTVSSYVG